MADEKPRYRRQAGSSPISAGKAFVGDSFQDFQHGIGYGTSGPLSSATYGFNPISRNHTLLEWMYRGSWLTSNVVDAVADDMIRAGIAFDSDMAPDEIEDFHQYCQNTLIWQQLNETLKWSRLYGGALAVMMIDGQQTDTPLRAESVGKGQFQGLLVLDRWMVWPHIEDLVKEPGLDYGKPRYYSVVADARNLPNWRIHHSRCLRFDGISLPYWQRVAENYWGLSVIEPLYDRLIAFDSATTGAAQLTYRACLRTYYVEQLRELIAAGGKSYQAFLQQIQLMRAMQANESMTILDATDKFETHQYAFSGLSDVLIQLAQQVSGACKVPLTRLFGQSPAGLNSTGEGDMRNYFEGIGAQQESRLRVPLSIVLDVAHRSRFGRPMPAGTTFRFNSLMQLTDEQKATVAGSISGAIGQSFELGIIGRKTALQELHAQSRITGVFSNITDEEIEDAENEPPAPEAIGNEEGGEEGAPAPEAIGGDPALPDNAARVARLSGAEAEREPTSPADQPEAKPVKLEPNKGEALHSITRMRPDDQSPRAPDHPGVEDSGPMRSAIVRKIADGFRPKDAARAVQREANGTELVGRRKPMTNTEKVARIVNTRDGLSMLDIGGISVIVETQKGARRIGYGWTTVMPCAYGYVQATSSAEGPREQMDAFVGPNRESKQVWVVNQIHPDSKQFDEHKLMLGFDSKEAAVAAYLGSYNDGPMRMGDVVAMPLDELKQWLQGWPYGRENRSGTLPNGRLH